MKFESTFEKTVRNLCDEVDYWREQAEMYKQELHDERLRHRKSVDDHYDSIKKSLGQALTFALHCTDDQNGNLVINKSDRQKLSKTI